MNREDIIRMAYEVFDVQTDSRGRTTFSGDTYAIERFATLVASAEREACAKIGDDHPSWSSRMYSATIRARGQA
jgi:hypothetical protein